MITEIYLRLVALTPSMRMKDVPSDEAEQFVITMGLKASFGYDNLYQRDHYGEGVDVGDINRIHSVIRSTD